MHIPKKISPDNIKESVIEVRYKTPLPFEVIPGIFYGAFDDSYFYTDVPLKPVKDSKSKLRSLSLIYNDKISVKIAPNSFVFNTLGQYIGWDDYRPQIVKAIEIILGTNVVTQWIRVGIRYITEYAHKDLRECTKFTFAFGHPDIKSDVVAFRSQFDYKNSKIILNLNNRVPVIEKDANDKEVIIPTSVIDIDVIRDGLKIGDSKEELLNLIDEIHIQEKEIYFGMLQEKFLTTLQPEY